MQNTVSPQLQGLVHSLGLLAIAFLAGRGVISATDGSIFEPLLEAVLGSAIGVGQVYFAMWQKKLSDAASQNAAQIAFSAGSQDGVTPVDKDHPAAVAAGQRALLAAGIKNGY